MEGMREEREVRRKESSMAERNCGGDGSNSRTREEEKGGGGLMLFGVRIDEMEGLQGETMRKSLSTGNLVSCGEQQKLMADGVDDNGYLSDGIVHSRNGGGGHQRKRGIPWTEEEHMTFLAGLEKLGKGDWKGISRKFVTTRTPTQVASHAQKHFLRQACNSNKKKKKRSSLFDMAIPDFNAGSSNGVDNKMEASSESFVALPTVTTHQASELHINAVGGSCGGFEFAYTTLSLAELPDHANPTPDNRAYQQAYMPYLPQPPLPIPAVSETMCTPSLFTCSSILVPSCIASSASAETSDLELRIAPPQPFSHRTLPMFFYDYIIRDNIRVP